MKRERRRSDVERRRRKSGEEEEIDMMRWRKRRKGRGIGRKTGLQSWRAPIDGRSSYIPKN